MDPALLLVLSISLACLPVAMAKVVVEMDGQEAKLWRAQQKIIHQQQAMDTGYKKVAKTSKRATDTAERGMRRASVSTSQFVGQLGAAAGGGTALLGVLREINAEAQRAGQALKTNLPSMGRLGQLAGSRADRQRLEGNALEILKLGGAATPDQAAELEFTLQSIGGTQDREFFSMLRASQLTQDPAALANLARGIQSNLPSEGLSLQQILDRTMAGSLQARADINQLTLASAEAAQGARVGGFSSSDAIALTALLSESVTPERAGTQARDLLMRLPEDLRGQGIVAAVRGLQERGLSEQQLRKTLGSETAFAGFGTAAANLEKLESNVGAVSGSAGGSGGATGVSSRSSPNRSSVSSTRRRRRSRSL